MKIKDVILKDFNIKPVGIKGLEITNRRQENNENYVSLVGTKGQINTYLQNAPILSERLRTLKTVPKYRIISTKRIRQEIY